MHQRNPHRHSEEPNAESPHPLKMPCRNHRGSFINDLCVREDQNKTKKGVHFLCTPVLCSGYVTDTESNQGMRSPTRRTWSHALYRYIVIWIQMNKKILTKPIEQRSRHGNIDPMLMRR